VDVGQGDATVWQLPDGSIVVYDCGPPAGNATSNAVVGYLTSIGHAPGTKVFALIASHGHLDHIGGCEEVLASYEVAHIYEVWYEGPDAPNSYNRWITDVINENATVHTARATEFLESEQVFHQGDPLALPQGAFDDGLRAQVLWPANAAVPPWADIGLYSLAVRWSFGNIDFCTDGDLESDQEAAMASSASALNCEIYLVGHHGSAYSSSSAWLSKMRPTVAVVSVGENDYGHPTSSALCRVQQAGGMVFATERLGTITVTTDGVAARVAPNQPETIAYCAAGASYWPVVAPPPPPAPPPGTANLSITASPSSTDPCQYTTVTVEAHVARETSPVAGTLVNSTWHYKTSTPTESGTTDASGDVSMSRYISGANADYTVVVDVEASSGAERATASTSFTPRAC
jgi:beta-lactamase superfamily II metal-dependent hydrolase